MRLVLTFGGAYAPRYVRGNASTLSNHAWGAAFDLNEDHNLLGHVPPLRGQRGAVRELVPRRQRVRLLLGRSLPRTRRRHALRSGSPARVEEVAMEWVEVQFPATRDVFIDKRLVGPTNKLLVTREGRQTIDLGPGGGYRPARADE